MQQKLQLQELAREKMQATQELAREKMQAQHEEAQAKRAEAQAKRNEAQAKRVHEAAMQAAKYAHELAMAKCKVQIAQGKAAEARVVEIGKENARKHAAAAIQQRSSTSARSSAPLCGQHRHRETPS